MRQRIAADDVMDAMDIKSDFQEEKCSVADHGAVLLPWQRPRIHYNAQDILQIPASAIVELQKQSWQQNTLDKEVYPEDGIDFIMHLAWVRLG